MKWWFFATFAWPNQHDRKFTRKALSHCLASSCDQPHLWLIVFPQLPRTSPDVTLPTSINRFASARLLGLADESSLPKSTMIRLRRLRRQKAWRSVD